MTISNATWNPNARWDAWVARGVERDLRTRDRIKALGIVLVIALVSFAAYLAL